MLLGSVLLAAAVFLGVPVEFDLPPAGMSPQGGHAYTATLARLPWPLVVGPGDSPAANASSTRLLEDGRALGPAHVSHHRIRLAGRGRYSHWGRRLYFSTSDNTDPRANGRRYDAVLRVYLAREMLWGVLLGFGLAAALVLVRGLRGGRIGRSDLLLPAVLGTGAVPLFVVLGRTEGVAFWLLSGLGAVVALWTVALSRRTFVREAGRRWNGRGRAQNATLFLASLCLALAAAEAFLWLRERRAVEPAAAGKPAKAAATGPSAEPGEGESTESVAAVERALETFGVTVPRDVLRRAARRAALVTLPPELDREPAKAEGPHQAVYWHGVLHVKDVNGMRRTAPFPARREGVFRVMVVGDSLTYGDGIDERWTYPRQLEALLEPDYVVEVLNLGVDGNQSEDVLDVVEAFLGDLRPDLVVYGVCRNDFLPAGTGQYRNNYAYAIPLPEAVKQGFLHRSRLVRLSADAYDRTLLRLGLRADFIDVILDGFAGYQQRFARDVARLNEVVRARGLPPVVALTLDQAPRTGSRGYRIAQTAEHYLASAGMDVIGMEPYYRHFDGQSFRVSRWEGHPNEAANAIWAVMLDRHLRSHPALREFRKPERARIPPPAAKGAP